MKDRNTDARSLELRVEGCLLGLVLGDALGSTFEGSPVEQLRKRFTSAEDAFRYSSQRELLRYTDDGQMALATAEHLCEHSHVEAKELMRSYVAHYEPWRGYGRGARVLIEAFRDSADYEFLAEHLFPGGSLGNGGAMRSSVVGLAFTTESEIWQQAKSVAWPTHRHELGIEGAQLVALSARYAAQYEEVTPQELSEYLLEHSQTTVFGNRLRKLAAITEPAQLQEFGNGIEAHESVVTALGAFALNPDCFDSAISEILWLGGDTDTIAAMCGSLIGVRVQRQGLPQDPLRRLEGETFLDEVRRISERFARLRQ